MEDCVRNFYNIRLWYRFMCRHTRALRRMCVSLLTIALAVTKVIDAVAKLYSSWML